ncbi:MAG: isoleucine--tRNA ligase [Patescibacteria group bacterium]
MAKFKPVLSSCDFPAMEQEILDYWISNKIVEKYLKRNEKSGKKFSFLDGPITANNPMGVHHAWGRTYKDLWQRFFNMKGFRQRFQNGFDEQGLWVEVEVEKDLGIKNKKEIEELVPSDKFKSLEKFINLCKDRVKKYSKVQTEQSKRLGYFMDWDDSYHTSSDENNYAIWNFIKVVNDRGWLYKGRDSVPWCPRCGTAISQHEILTEEYKELIHEAVFVRFPIDDIRRKNQYLLIWTTTPWTLPSNVAIAVDPEKRYFIEEDLDTKEQYIIINPGEREDAGLPFKVNNQKGFKKVGEMRGDELIGLVYKGAFDDFPAVKKEMGNLPHRVIPTDNQILPVNPNEGTGLIHIAPGAGAEDFQLAKKENLPVIESIDEEALYLEGFEDLTGKNANESSDLIIKKLEDKGFIFRTEKYTHRYPTCWRCKTELVWRVVDEWYIAMDRDDEFGKTFREQMIEVAKKINWIPEWGLDRELDWLKNMHDWLISKKRYWGLALPVWECEKCKTFEVIGNKEELEKKAVDGWDKFAGKSPHRPWVDQIKVKCTKCGEVASRISDVGSPWLDAGIVSFSTMPEDWFPADFITESFPGQFKNWFYSLIAMSTALKKTNSFKTVLGFASVRDEKGEEMHKSKGNAIDFNEAAEKIGVDVMRWLYIGQNPEYNLNFGYKATDEVRRRFYLILWNSYKFFVDYALLTSWNTESKKVELSILDKWILARLMEVILRVNKGLAEYDGADSVKALEEFIVGDFSTWYIRRSRDKVGPGAGERERSTTLSVMHEVLVTLVKLLAPFMPFISEEIYRNLTGKQSVHLEDYPTVSETKPDEKLIKDMMQIRKIAEIAHAKRKEAGIRLRQPLGSLVYKLDQKLDQELEQILADETNVKKIEHQKSSKAEPEVILDTKITQSLKEEGEVRDLIRQIQQERKAMGLTLKDKTKIIAPSWPKAYEKVILQNTASVSLEKGPEFKVLKVS